MFFGVGAVGRQSIVGKRGVQGASLDLGFMLPGVLDPRITFTRASTATYFDSTGTLQTAAINAPRWDYNPSTRALNGLLIEEARTNSTVNSGAMATSWVPSAATIVAGVAVAPDGTTTAAKFTESNTAVAHTLASPFAPLTATQYTFSVFAKAGGRSILFATGVGMTGAGVIPQWDLSAGTDISSGVAASFFHGIQAVGNGWYRCWFSFLSAGTAAVVYSPALVAGGTNAYLGDGVSGIFMWGAQSEIGTFLTSYIPTTAASVTRSPDVATMTTSPWFTNPLAFSCAVDAILVGVGTSGAASYIQFDDGTSPNRSNLATPFNNPWVTYTEVVAGVTTLSASSIFPGAGTPFKAAYATVTGNHQLAVNGVAAAANANAAGPPSVTTLRFGKSTTANVGALYLRRFRYWPRVLSAAELQSVTT